MIHSKVNSPMSSKQRHLAPSWAPSSIFAHLVPLQPIQSHGLMVKPSYIRMRRQITAHHNVVALSSARHQWENPRHITNTYNGNLFIKAKFQQNEQWRLAHHFISGSGTAPPKGCKPWKHIWGKIAKEKLIMPAPNQKATKSAVSRGPALAKIATITPSLRNTRVK